MDIRQLTETFAAAPQLDPSDMAQVAAAGFVAVICNRPDAEIPPSHHAQAMQSAAEAAGLQFLDLPLTHRSFTPDNIASNRAFAEAANGPVVAYCASGTRSTIAWALGQAGHMDVDEIIQRAASAGYDISHLRQALS